MKLTIEMRSASVPLPPERRLAWDLTIREILYEAMKGNNDGGSDICYGADQRADSDR